MTSSSSSSRDELREDFVPPNPKVEVREEELALDIAAAALRRASTAAARIYEGRRLYKWRRSCWWCRCRCRCLPVLVAAAAVSGPQHCPWL